MTLTLLPAVDVADGQAVRLVQGAAGSETVYGDPLEAALAWQRDGAEWIHLVDLDAAFGRGSNAELLADVVAGSTSRWSCPAASATTSRCARRWPPARPGSTSAPPRWRTRSGATGSSASTATGSRSGSTCAAHTLSRPRLDPRRRRPVRGAGAARQGRLPAVRGHRRAPRRHADRAQPRRCCARCARRTDQPVIASGGVSTLDDLRALAAAGAGRRRGRHRRQGAVRGRVHRRRGAGALLAQS